MRTAYNFDWVSAFQNALRQAVESYFGNVEDWPFVTGSLRFEAYEWTSRYLMLVVRPIPETVIPMGPSARTPLDPEPLPKEMPSVANIEDWHQKIRQSLDLGADAVVLVIPLSDEPNIDADWDSWDDAKQALWTRQIEMIFTRQVRERAIEGRDLSVQKPSGETIKSRAYRRHPAIKEPDDLDSPLWRYMSFTKYVSLLETGALYFARADQLGDPYEGSTSVATLQLRPTFYGEEAASRITEDHSLVSSIFRAFTFVSCWHMSTYESAAMWSLYSDGGPNVAVLTTFRRLLESIQDDREIYCGLVKYLDYKSEQMPEGNSIYPFMHKRRSYEHEREVRALFMDLPDDFQEPAEGFKHPGHPVPVDLHNLISRVYIAPAAPTWFRDLVQAVTKRYGLSGLEVTQSELDEGPVY